MMDYAILFPKSAIPLSIVRGGMWGTGDAIVLDTASNRFHVISAQGDGNHDYFFDQFSFDSTPRKYRIKSGFYGPEIQHARLVQSGLEDFIVRTAALDEGFAPGGVYTEATYAPELCPPRWKSWIRDLCRTSSWPNAAVLKTYLFPGNLTVPSRPFDEFESSDFLKEMQLLKQNITIKYMPDWYVPVPRVEDYIQRLEEQGDLDEGQLAYARSDEEAIPLNLKGWGDTYLFTKH